LRGRTAGKPKGARKTGGRKLWSKIKGFPGSGGKKTDRKNPLGKNSMQQGKFEILLKSFVTW